MKHVAPCLCVLFLISLALPDAASAVGTPVPVAPPRVVGLHTDDAPGDQKLISVAPDGRHVAVTDARGLCVEVLPTFAEQGCARLRSPGPFSVDEPRVAWSPDSTRLAFSEDAFTLLVNGDIWVLDVASGKLTDLTPDGVTGNLFDLFQGTPLPGVPAAGVPVDIAPAWSADGRTIYFARSYFRLGSAGGTTIERIAATGGTPTTVATVSTNEPGVIYVGGIHPSRDGRAIYYTLGHSVRSNPENGVWQVDANGDRPRQLLGGTDPRLGFPVLLATTPAGDWGIVVFSAEANSDQVGPPLSLVNLKSGAVTRLKPASGQQGRLAHAVRVAFSPDGSTLAYGWSDIGTAEDQHLIARNLGTGAERVLLAGGFHVAPRFAFTAGLTWATNDTLLGLSVPPTGVQMVQLGSA